MHNKKMERKNPLIKALQVREELEYISETLYEHGKGQIADFLEFEVIKNFDIALRNMSEYYESNSD